MKMAGLNEDSLPVPEEVGGVKGALPGRSFRSRPEKLEPRDPRLDGPKRKRDAFNATFRTFKVSES